MINIETLNNNSKIVGSIIIFIVFIIGIIIIIDEFINISKFCYKYTYLYNYGNINENICKEDTIEYEKSRFRVYNEINKYKLEKDLFNKNWIHYLVYFSIFILTILICVSFGYLFYHFFIDGNFSCSEDNENLSFFKSVLKCFCNDCHKLLPNCTLNYLMLIAIIIIYPIFNIFKFTLNINLNNYVFIIVFYILLFYYAYVLFNETKEYEMKERIFIIFIYILFVSVFYLSQFIFTNISNNYNNITHVSNLYKNDDDIFFDIYKQEEPLKPLEIPIPTDENNNNLKLLPNFNYCNTNDYTNSKNKECYGKQNDINYIKNKEKIDKYYNDLNIYKNDMKNYTNKYNIYKNNKIDFPGVIYIFTMFYKLFGLEQTNIRYLLLFLIIVIIIYVILRNNNNQYASYFYYTVVVYVISVLVLLILSNAILTYNTYLNKYLIYEPTTHYKYNLNNMNILFNIQLNDNYKNLENYYFESKNINIKNNDNVNKPTVNELLALSSANKVYTMVNSFSSDTTSDYNKIIIPNNYYYFKYTKTSGSDYLNFNEIFEIKSDYEINLDKPLDLTLTFNKDAQIYSSYDSIYSQYNNNTITIKDTNLSINTTTRIITINNINYFFNKNKIILPTLIKDQYNNNYNYNIKNTFVPNFIHIYFKKDLYIEDKKISKDVDLKEINTNYSIELYNKDKTILVPIILSNNNITKTPEITSEYSYYIDIPTSDYNINAYSLRFKKNESDTNANNIKTIIERVLFKNFNNIGLTDYTNTLQNYIQTETIYNKEDNSLFVNITDLIKIYEIDKKKLQKKIKQLVFTFTETVPTISQINITDTTITDENKTSELIKLYKKNIFVIDKILNVFMDFIEKIKKIITNILNSTSTSETCVIINKDNFESIKTSYNTKRTEENKKKGEKQTNTYDTIITKYKTNIDNLNDYYRKYFNIITYIIKTEFNKIESFNKNKNEIIEKIIDNYNIYNIDNKHIHSELILKRDIQMNTNEYNKYMDMKTLQEQELKKSTNSVVWSYVILNIIFAMVLLEPQLL